MTATIATSITIERFKLPPIPAIGGDGVYCDDRAAVVRSGDIRAEVDRFAYWDARDNKPLSIEFMVRIYGCPSDGACSEDVYAQEPDVLFRLARVSTAAAKLLSEFQGTE